MPNSNQSLQPFEPIYGSTVIFTGATTTSLPKTISIPANSEDSIPVRIVNNLSGPAYLRFSEGDAVANNTCLPIMPNVPEVISIRPTYNKVALVSETGTITGNLYVTVGQRGS